MSNKCAGLACIALMFILTSCAAGAATAGYSIKAQSADSLSASAEQRLVDRIKNEIAAEQRISSEKTR